MATRSQNSEERPIRDLPDTPDPRPEEGTSASRTETNDTNKRKNSRTFEDTTNIWKAEKDGEGYFVPAHIWFASVVFPLFAGAFGPMSSAFGICALAGPWRLDSASHTNIENPRWLIALTALSFALSLIANIALLLAMANRLPFLVSQLLTVPSFFVSSVILIVITTLTSHTLLPSSQEYYLASPFYYACISAALSMLISLLLTYTFYLARLRHETPADLSATLTLPQRTLTFQSLAFICYLMAGAAIFSAIEGWKFTDGVYWTTVTLLTIGFGDIVPKTHAGRSLIIFYATAGIVSIGLVIGSIASLVLDRSAKKMVARKMVNVRMKKVRDGLPREAKREGPVRRDEHESEQHVKNEKAEFTLMREIQADVASSQQWQLAVVASIAIAMLWFFGAAVFWSTEKASQSWTYFDALYFTFISLLTIGYGDFEVATPAGRSAFVFWAFLAVPTMTILTASMGATFLIAVKAIIHKIDAFVVLPHESGRQDSYFNKMHKMGKLKAKERFGNRLGWGQHSDGRERYWHPEHGEGVRNPDTGVVHHDHRTIHRNLPEDEQLTHQDLLYHLAREIRLLLPIVSSNDKKYSYEEWTKYIHLLNHDASKKDRISTANWSWLDEEGPLFRGKNETAWILERLSLRLEKELKKDTREGRKLITDGEGDG